MIIPVETGLAPSSCATQSRKRFGLSPLGTGASSVYQFVVAGLAAGSAVEEAVGAKAHAQFGLAEHAIFFAAATDFRPLALDADDAAYTWFRGHGRSLVRPRQRWNVTEVTQGQAAGVRCQVSGKATR